MKKQPTDKDRAIAIARQYGEPIEDWNPPKRTHEPKRQTRKVKRVRQKM